MSILEQLYYLEQTVNMVLNTIDQEQQVLEKFVAACKKERWEQFYDDLMKYSKYTKYIDTGSKLKDHNGKLRTFGFEVRKDYICFIDFVHHYNCQIGKMESKTDTFYFVFRREQPFRVDGNLDSYAKYLFEIVENWNSYIPEVERNIEYRMRQRMNDNIQKHIEKQNKLENALERFS